MRADDLRSLLEYDPTSGQFVWLKRNDETRGAKIFNARFAGKAAGVTCLRGYRYIKINQVVYAAGRLAWAYVNGEWPSGEIDHIDGNPSNNAIANLRVATRSENGANRGVHKNSASGVKGVYFDKSRGKWVAQAGGRGHRIDVRCDTLEDARAAYEAAAKSLYGDFARTA